MVKDYNKQPAFDDHMKKYDRSLPDEERIKILKQGVILRKVKKVNPRNKKAPGPNIA